MRKRAKRPIGAFCAYNHPVIPALFIYFGLVVGSFLNVLILRWGMRSLNGRSECVSCGSRIAWYDLVPVFSWIFLGGRCRACGGRISLQYPLVEASTAALFLIIGLSPLPFEFQLLALPIAALLLAIAVYDLYHTIIPDAWVYAFAGLSLLASLLALPQGTPEFSNPHHYALLFASGPLVALPLFALWFISRGAAMGFGDVKFALGMGWLLGLSSGLIALFLSFILGALISVPLLFFSSATWQRFRTTFTPMRASRGPSLGFTMKSEIPFGPFLIAATFIVWFTNMHGYDLLDLVAEVFRL